MSLGDGEDAGNRLVRPAASPRLLVATGHGVPWAAFLPAEHSRRRSESVSGPRFSWHCRDASSAGPRWRSPLARTRADTAEHVRGSRAMARPRLRRFESGCAFAASAHRRGHREQAHRRTSRSCSIGNRRGHVVQARPPAAARSCRAHPRAHGVERCTLAPWSGPRESRDGDLLRKLPGPCFRCGGRTDPRLVRLAHHPPQRPHPSYARQLLIHALQENQVKITFFIFLGYLKNAPLLIMWVPSSLGGRRAS